MVLLHWHTIPVATAGFWNEHHVAALFMTNARTLAAIIPVLVRARDFVHINLNHIHTQQRRPHYESNKRNSVVARGNDYCRGRQSGIGRSSQRMGNSSSPY